MYHPSVVWLYQPPGHDRSVSAAEHREAVDAALCVISASQPARANNVIIIIITAETHHYLLHLTAVFRMNLG